MRQTSRRYSNSTHSLPKKVTCARAMALTILSRSSWRSTGMGGMYTLSFTNPQNEKSMGVRLGNLGGHGMSPPRQVWLDTAARRKRVRSQRRNRETITIQDQIWTTSYYEMFKKFHSVELCCKRFSPLFSCLSRVLPWLTNYQSIQCLMTLYCREASFSSDQIKDKIGRTCGPHEKWQMYTKF
jgi:hypothetical protein